MQHVGGNARDSDGQIMRLVMVAEGQGHGGETQQQKQKEESVMTKLRQLFYAHSSHSHRTGHQHASPVCSLRRRAAASPRNN
eukprot:SAG11_NODE_29164_length_314_cov_0.525581_1_plen_81_part_01